MDKKELDNYKDYDYYKQLLDNIIDNEITDKKTHYEYLLLWLLVLQPPLRSGVYVSCIIQNTAKINYIDNYFILTHKAGITKRAYYSINSDKVSNTKSYSDKI